MLQREIHIFIDELQILIPNSEINQIKHQQFHLQYRWQRARTTYSYFIELV